MLEDVLYSGLPLTSKQDVRRKNQNLRPKAAKRARSAGHGFPAEQRAAIDTYLRTNARPVAGIGQTSGRRRGSDGSRVPHDGALITYWARNTHAGGL